ncbi:hypothetical protein Salat_1330300 [Sesamum alatum]|uniref:Nutrient reservoir n=1 Tax=Sesamum alatum TaxID=300844 RepID=A0AAE2CQ03_9LAMI|nr:hypothetical protein Salat_1330300 [Sesamum alatum]
MARLRLLQITTFLAIILSASAQAEKEPMNSRKLDDESPPDLDNKCGSCPCNSPCIPLPSPPPPSPPPPPKNPQPSNCPPPPSGQNPPSRPSPPYIYVNGPPGNLYPVYPYNSGHSRSFSMGIIPFLISSSILWLLAF